MSKFFGGRSDSESSSESEASSDEEVQVQNNKRAPRQINAAAILFSDDETDDKRVVRSAKEKRYETLFNIIKTIRNSKKIKDFNKMLSSFEDLLKAFEKAKPVIKKEDKGIVPLFYIRILVEMEDLVNETWEDSVGRKAMSKVNGKSLGGLRQKLRKYIRENLESDCAKFRENPDAEDEEEEAEEEKAESDAEDPETEVRAGSVPKEKGSKKKMDDDSEDEWPSSSDSSSESDDEKPTGGYTRDMFLKKAVDPEEEQAKARKKAEKLAKREEEKEKRQRKAEEEDDEDGDDGGWNVVDRTAQKIAMFAKDAEITHDLVAKKLMEIVAARGKKKTNRKEQIELLNELYDISNLHSLGPGMAVKIKFAIISALFDYNPKLIDAMKPDSWEKCIAGVDNLLDLLAEHAEIIITGNLIMDENEILETEPYKVRGCYLTAVEKLDEEFIKVLKACDAHSNEYVDRLKDEPLVVKILEKAEVLVLKSGSPSEICRIYLKKIEHIYFKFDPTVIDQKAGKVDASVQTSMKIMDELCKYIYSKDSTDRLRTRAILCHIYHNAIHDSWYEARDLMLMSHLQDSVHHSDPATQILYNRTMVQLGLCGFRHAAIKDAHNALLDIQLGGRSKELLAQGLLPQRQHERSSEQEKIEKSRQMPFHMHINLEMLECVYLVSAMLIEIPYLSAHEYDARRRMISKSYYQQLRSSERQALVGPPESMREHVVAASKAMRNGDWRKARDFIINDKMNAKVWDLFYDADNVRKMLSGKIQEESMRTYLFTYSNVYDSISIPVLAEMFELEVNGVHALVSKMIINEELMASLDQPTQCIVMHRTEPSRLQSLALQLSDKIGQLVENNERLLEQRGQGWGGQRNWENRGEGGQGGRGGGGGGGGGYRGNREGGGGGYRGNRDGGGRGGRDGNYGGREGGGNFKSRNEGNFGGFKSVSFRGGREGGGGGYRRDQERSQSYGKAWN